ncbi:MAG: TlpA family protein disulfide reductase [Sphingobacteriales bacterium]|nr:MAG: TlpA family protein disulfide reductase [Sphingobacteriales bacterium]
MKRLLSTIFLACSVYVASAQVPDNGTINVGQKAPELAFNNPAGETLKLSEISKGRIVLLDFWASWCRPCRMANPKLTKLYDEYKDKKIKGAKKGFTIVSVSLDQNKEAWIAAIDKDKLVWPYHMSDLGSWNSKAAELYGVQYIPQAFLVDADGKIIGKYQFAEQAEADLKKLVKE